MALAQKLVEVDLPDYEASEQQTKLHLSKAFETFYGGAAGGGKSVCLCAEAITACLDYPGHRVFFFRKTLKNLRQGTLPVLMQQIAPYMNIPDSKKPRDSTGKTLTIKYNSQDSILRFSNGSFIQFAYLNTLADIYNYSSIEMHLLIFDEVTQFQGEEYEFLKTRVRTGDDRPLRILCASNPGDIGHNYFKERFITSPDPNVEYVPEQIFEEVIEDEITGEEYVTTRMFIPAKVTDNPNEHIRKDYRRNLNSIADPQLRRALLLGDWDTFMGRVYTEWNRDVHVIPELPRDVVLSECVKYIGFDWGYRDPAVATWLAYAPENEMGVRHLYAYREIHESGKTPEWWAEKISDIIAQEEIEYMILPHDCYSQKLSDSTIASVFSEWDIPCVRANSMNHAAKMHRIAILHQMLSLADDSEPYLQFVESKTPNCIRTIPTLPYSKTRAEEIDDKADDHDFDSLTYALMIIDDPEGYILDTSPGNRSPELYNSNNLSKALKDSENRWRR